MKRQTALMALALIVGLGSTSAPVRAENRKIERAYLQGLDGVLVAVENLSPAAESAGLHREQLITDVELRLRTAGVKVLTEEEWRKLPGLPTLYVNVNAVPEGSGFIYSVNVEIAQACLVDRGEGQRMVDDLLRDAKGAFTDVHAASDLKVKVVIAALSLHDWTTQRRCMVPTWGTGSLGRGGVDRVRQVVRDYVDEFGNAYLTANPKK